MENDARQTVLVVDDAPENIDVLVGVLNEEYRVKAATSGERALQIATSAATPDLVLLDITMPLMDGYEVCRRLKSNPATRRIPVIFVTARGDAEDETRGFELGAEDYVTKPVHPAVVRSRVRTHLALHDQNRVLEDMVRLRTAELQETRLEIIRRLGRAAEFKDNETGMHVMRMSHYAELIGRACGLGEDKAELLLHAAPMHDIGKIGIADSILLKPGKLDANEWESMKTHTTIGAAIIGDHPHELLQLAQSVAITHHERWNGQGYPEGFVGDEIPQCGRVVAIADVFDALTSKRPYKDAWPVERAFDLIREERGEHFDPAMVDAFFDVVPQILEIMTKYAEE